MHHFFMFIATGAYTGYSKVAPGTVGTLVVFPLLFLTMPFSIIFKMFVFVALFILGIASAEYVETYLRKKDPSMVVIDEIAAYYMIAMFYTPTMFNYIVSFLFFRFFDILKPWPIRRLEGIGGGVGIMVDDLLAALYAAVCLLIAKAVFL